MAKTKKQEKKMWRFYRSSMPTIVWDPINDKALADFTEGHFTTDDPSVAKKLREMGYLEIPLDATEPPDIIVRPPAHVIEGDIPLMRGAAAPKLMEAKMERIPKKTVGKTQTSKKAPRKLKTRRKKSEK